jgi:hypothetical protein
MTKLVPFFPPINPLQFENNVFLILFNSSFLFLNYSFQVSGYPIIHKRKGPNLANGERAKSKFLITLPSSGLTHYLKMAKWDF